MDKDQQRIKYMEFVQSVITRLNNNSFKMKGWCIAIMVASITLSVNTGNRLYLWVELFSAIIMWYLDTTFLIKEKQYRHLYDDIRLCKKDESLFDMDASKYNVTFWSTFFSKTIYPFYIFVLVVYICIYFFFK